MALHSHIVVEAPIEKDDIKSLKKHFEKEYASWHIEFASISSIAQDMLFLLSDVVFLQKKNIKITTHESKLNHYLYTLGFTSSFEPLLTQHRVKVDSIEVVLVGGSADSSAKIIEIVKRCSFRKMALLIVQHSAEDDIGIFDKILSEYTTHKVSYAKDGQKIKNGAIYLAPHAKHLKVTDGYFSLSDEEEYNYARPSISLSYESFSNYYKEKLLVVHECGYAKDGVDKLALLHSNSSKIIIQDSKECIAKSMVQNALDTEIYDYVLTLENIILYINTLDINPTKDSLLEYLLQEIYKKYNYDFRLYHREMMQRRLDIFMLKYGFKEAINAVVAILFHRSAFKAFFLEVSINVTQLFRNPHLFKIVAKEFADKYNNHSSIKIWSAGCSSGEEISSIAILLDILGLLEKSILYATDFNSVILEEAKNGIYSYDSYLLAKKNFKEVGLEANLDDYINVHKNYVLLKEKIKEKILYFQHNLIEDSSFNEFDVIICKNVIIYFEEHLQERVFALFYDSLKFGGYLVLGHSEMLSVDFRDKFLQIDASCKIFKKVA